jgi:acetyl esterase/lipase
MASPQLFELMNELGAMAAEYFEALGPPANIARLRESMRPVTKRGVVPATVTAVPVVADGVRCEWVCDKSSDSNRRLVYLHGGAYVGGDLDMYRAHAAQLASVTGCSVLNVDYRLAPEASIIDARDDAIAAYRWAVSQGPRGATEARRMFISGDSAGGGLTVSSCYGLVERGERRPDALVTICGAFDMGMVEAIPEAQRELFGHMKKLFLGDLDPRNPVVSPIYGALASLPPVLVHVGGAELALVENVRFHERAKAAGVDVTFELWPEMPHVWHLFAPFLPEANAALASIAKFLRRFD